MKVKMIPLTDMNNIIIILKDYEITAKIAMPDIF